MQFPQLFLVNGLGPAQISREYVYLLVSDVIRLLISHLSLLTELITFDFQDLSLGLVIIQDLLWYQIVPNWT